MNYQKDTFQPNSIVLVKRASHYSNVSCHLCVCVKRSWLCLLRPSVTLDKFRLLGLKFGLGVLYRVGYLEFYSRFKRHGLDKQYNTIITV
jgi:hypothetical protein